MDRLEGEALRLANDVRAELGLGQRGRLESGFRDMPDNCPIARTIRAGAEGLRVEVDRGVIDVWVGQFDGEPAHSWTMGTAASEFATSFDCGGYPALVEEICR